MYAGSPLTDMISPPSGCLKTQGEIFGGSVTRWKRIMVVKSCK
jgi:hypothetical protein